MNELAQWLRDWAADKAASDPRFKHTAFIISGERGMAVAAVCSCLQLAAQLVTNCVAILLIVGWLVPSKVVTGRRCT